MASINFTDFEYYLFRKEYAKETIYRTLRTLKRINKKYKSLSIENIDAYLLDLKKRNRKGSHLNGEVKSIRRYGKFIGNKDFKNYPFFKTEPAIKSIMTDDEIEYFLKLKRWDIGKMQPKELYKRFNLFWGICAYTGMRTGEVAGLMVDNVLEDGFYLTKTKTNKPRFVPLPENLKKSVKSHVSNCDYYLFPKKKSEGYITRTQWGSDFRKRIQAMGIKRKGLTPYSLRHSKATRMIEENVNLFQVQKILGHANIQTTAQYVHLTRKDTILANEQDRIITKHIDAMKQVKKVEEMLNKIPFNPKFFDMKKVRIAIANFINELENAIKK